MAHIEELSAAFLGDQIITLNSKRSEAAFRMKLSAAEIPHAWLVMEADVTSLAELLSKLADPFMKAEGVPLTIEPFVMKSVVYALKEFPLLNSSWSSGRILLHKPIHLSVPVESGDAMTDLVVRQVDHKSIAGLAIAFHDLMERAKRGSLAREDMQGGTFTFVHAGESAGSHLSKRIIAYPQGALLSFERIIRKPVVIEDKIAIRAMAHLCLSFDHRILDGWICGRFLQRVKHYLEKYDGDTVIY